MRSELCVPLLSALLLAGCFAPSATQMPGAKKISLQEACDCAVEHNSTVRFADRLKRLGREEREALTLTSLPDLENLSDATPPARRAELWFEALENALFYNYIPLSENQTAAEQRIRLREEELLRGKTTALYWLLAEEAGQLQKGNSAAPEKAGREKKIAAQSFELAVHIGAADRPVPGEHFSRPLKGTLEKLLREAGQRRAAMPELGSSSAAADAALRLYREMKKAPGYTPGKIVRALFYLPSFRVRSNERPVSKELNALTFLLGNAAELDLLLEAREKARSQSADQRLKIEAMLQTARGFGNPRPLHVSEKAIRQAEAQMRELLRAL